MLRGNLAPRGAIIKQSAATPALMQHTGRAVVFDSLEDLAARIDAPDLDVDADDVLVLRNAGPMGAPGMPEAGYLPIPTKLARAGREGHGAHLRRAHERHRVRHDRAARDARSRRSAARSRWCATATRSASTSPARRLDAARRRRRARAPARGARRQRRARRGAGAGARLRGALSSLVLQADEGCDFDFLVPGRPAGRRERHRARMRRADCAPPQPVARAAANAAAAIGRATATSTCSATASRYPLDRAATTRRTSRRSPTTAP